MSEIDPQFLQQRRLPVIALRPERRYPARPQSPLLPHAPADALPAESGRRPEPAGARVCLRGGRLAVAVLCLGGGGVPGDGGRVGGLVELEVLRVVGLLLLRVVLGHGGRRGGLGGCRAGW